MTNKELIQRVAAKHLSKKALGEEAPDAYVMGNDALGDGLKSLGQRLKIAGAKQGVMQMREAFTLANELVVLLGTSAQRSDQPAVQNIAKRLMREHKQMVMSLV